MDNFNYTQPIQWFTNDHLKSSIELEFQHQQYQQFLLFCEKNKNYGVSNIAGGDDVDLNIPENKKDALLALYFRMRDKLSRFKQMIEMGSNGTLDENQDDTLNDLANYCNIGILVNNQKWK